MASLLSHAENLSAGEGWEGMEDGVEALQPEVLTAEHPESTPEAEPATAVEMESSVVPAGDQGEQDGDQPGPETSFVDGDNEGWEDMEDLAAPQEITNEAAEQEAAVHSQAAASEAGPQEVKSIPVHA